MRFRLIAGHVTLWSTTAAIAALATAAPRVEMTIGTERNQPVSASQQWYRALTDLGVDSLRIRSRRPGEEPQIEEQSSKRPGDAARIYIVTGVLDDRGQLHLPGGKFTIRDTGRLKAWLAKLRAGGESAVTGRGTTAFGMSAEQLALVQEDLATPLGFSTVDMSPAEVIEKARGQLRYKLSMEAAASALLQNIESSPDELRGLSTGTALAHVTRGAGLALAPTPPRDGLPAYEVRRASSKQTAWPVGWEPKQRATELAPRLYEILTVELDDIPVAQVTDAIGQRVELPVLYDRFACRRHGIDPSTVRVSVPEKRTSYSVALRLALGQARMKSELRVDDAGRPFLWVTTFKPVE